MNITEFLEARIAEDEAEAQVAKAEFTHGGYGCYGPARVLAECAAKRAIVQLQGEATREGYDNAAAYLWDALFALASVYRLHPDYQQEWAVGG